jgi:hypothetical protein
MSRWERGAIVLTPLAAVATMAVGLRLGASPSVRAAVVYGAPPSRDHAGLAWQLLTLVDDRSVKEAVAMPGLSVVARAGEREARWEGATNADGVAEMWLDLPGVAAGDAVSIEVRASGEKAPLATGAVAWPSDAARDVPAGPSFARPSKQDGELLIEVAIYGSRLVPGSPSSVWVHVRDRATGADVAGATLEADTEPGLSLTAARVTTDESGWAELHATAQIHVVALGLRSETRGGTTPRRGAWYGALPVAPGASIVDVPFEIPAGEPHAFDVVVPTVLPRVYVEVDDDVGRAFATALDVERTESGPHAVVHVRPLPAGNYWLVTAGDPRGAESVSGAAVARPFVVGDAPTAGLGPHLATVAPPRFSRFVALDGLPGRRRAEGGRHRQGILLAFGSLAIAAALEALLILRGVQRARRELAHMAEMLDNPGKPLENRFSATNVVLGLLIALLGFALLAALLTWKAG